MSGLRLWIVLLAAVSFLAGIPAGVLIAEGRRPAAGPEGPFGDYIALFEREFELDSSQRVDLRAVMTSYQWSLDEIISSRLGEFEGRIAMVGEQHLRLVRDAVLRTDAERLRFDALSGPFALSSVGN